MPDQMTIALWGPTQAGKTAFLAQIYLRHQAITQGWDIFPTAESQAFLKVVRDKLNMNFFPDATTPGTSDAPDLSRQVRYMFRHQHTGREAVLFVEDRAGKESTMLDEAGKERLNKADGLILLFDPQRPQRELEQQIEGTLGELHIAGERGFAKDPRPVAVCLSKADQLIETPGDLRRAQKHPTDFVNERISAEIVKWVGRFCSDFELFPISSLGVRVRFGCLERVVFYDENGRPRLSSGNEPLNLIEPFAWLFSHLGRSRQ